MTHPSLSALKASFAPADAEKARMLFRQAKDSCQNQDKIMILDDDPTGTQTVHDVTVYTNWSPAAMDSLFAQENPVAFILTNSRALTETETRALHTEIAENACAAAQKAGCTFQIISRGDSTLRGHFPLETETLRRTIEARSSLKFDAEIICPFFPEGGRYTCGGIHYVAYGDELVPAGETEFAGDKTFGYHCSFLPEWVEEKSNGQIKSNEVVCFTVEELRAMDMDALTAKLLACRDFQKITVDALCDEDLTVFCAALWHTIAQGRRYMFRTAAAFINAMTGITRRPLLSKDELLGTAPGTGGLIIAGSHTKKTTAQLARLEKLDNFLKLEVDQSLALQPDDSYEKEIDRVAAICDEEMEKGKVVLVSTRRERVDVPGGSEEDQLKLAVRISAGLTSVVAKINRKPAFLIAKGGITSSDVGVKGLGVQRALAAGQAAPGVPVWHCGAESRFPGLACIIFPGNVGDENTLSSIVEKISKP